MISKVKDLMAVGEKLEEMSGKVKAACRDVSDQSKGLAELRKEVSGLRSGMKALCEEHDRSAEHAKSCIEDLHRTNEELKKELYDFKLIKADIKSKLVSEISQDFRDQLREETKKLDTDVKQFNELKTELSRLVAKFRSVEDEIQRFKEIASGIKTADFELARHAKELEKADSEKLRLMQKIDQLERLVSKMRRSSR